MKRPFLILLTIFYTISLMASRPLSFVKYQVENGLSHNTIWCILQDSYDFMWFGTSDGLNCFDGKNFRVFRHNSKVKTSLGNNFVQCLYEDKQRNIWVGTNKGLYIFDRKTETFFFFNHKTEDGVLISSNVNQIIKSNTGDIWIATLGQGIFIYNPDKHTLVQNSMYTSFVRNLLKLPNGNIVATSRQDGLISFDKHGKYLRSYNPFSNKDDISDIEISALCFRNNALWFSVGTDGFYKLDLKTGITKSIFPYGLSTVSNIRKIFPVSDHQFWIGGDNGLYSFDLNTGQLNRLDNPSNPKSLSDQSVCDIVRDREGGIWVSTYFGGVDYLPKNSKPFEHYFPLYQPGSLSGKAISQFCEDAKGDIWIATEDGGLNLLNTASGKVDSYQSLIAPKSIIHHNIHSLLLDQGKLWIGTSTRGIDVFDLQNKTTRNFEHRRDNLKSICDNNINSIYRDSRGVIYVGTTWGLSLYDRASDSFSLVEELGPMAHVFDIVEDRKGYVWVATSNTGVFRLDPRTNHWSHFTHIPGNPRSISDNSVISIFEDAKNILWFGTEGGGLCSFDPKSESFIPFDPENRLLPNQVIYAIEQDEFGNFWIATNAGLVRINPYTKRNHRVFTKADGLQSNQFNFHSSLRARDGKMYFGGINGFNAFYPKDFAENEYMPKVRITEFRLFNKIVNVTDEDSPLRAPVYDLNEIRLNHNQNTFSFSFVALSYQAPDKNKYAYQMEGVDKNWNIAENGNNTAYYTNLPPGTYTFRVKGSNNDGLWNNKETVLNIRILPPFWKSGIAYFIYLIIILLTFYRIYRLRLNRLKKAHEERLREFQVRQEKESYMSKIIFFTNLAHEIRTPLSLIKLPLERILTSGDGSASTRGFLATIDKNTDYLLNLINQLLDFRKIEETEFKLYLEKSDINDLIREVLARFRHSAEIKNINLTLLPADVDLNTSVDRDAFNKMVSNLLSNALKYAETSIEVRLNVYQHYFEILVSDDGKGISEPEKNRVFEAFYQSDQSKSGTGIGLAFAKALAEKHDGSLKYESKDPHGSTFVITIPITDTASGDKRSGKEEIASLAQGYPAEPHNPDFTTQKDRPANLLLVEDNVELLRLTAEYMRDFYQVHLATNGNEALSILSEEQIDIVVSDVMMPEMDGYQLCEAIKSETQHCHIPVILLTAKTAVEAKIMGLEYGSDAYLEKPFSLEHLRTQINNLLQGRQRLRTLFASSPLLPSVEIAVSKKDKEFVEKLNAEIEKRLSDVGFSIDMLSEMMNMSRSNFYRKIKSISGMSPNDYLKMIRLKKAAELLLMQEYRITEVYELVGFNSSSYFAKCFKDQFGMLPREFMVNPGKGEVSIK